MPSLREVLPQLLQAHLESQDARDSHDIVYTPYLLSQEQLRRWHKDGYLVLQVHFPQKTIPKSRESTICELFFRYSLSSR